MYHDNCRAVHSQTGDDLNSTGDQSAEEDRPLSVHLASRQVEADPAVQWFRKS